MPNEDELPDDIKDIVFKNGITIRPDPDFNHDVDRLVTGIDNLLLTKDSNRRAKDERR